MAAFAVDLGSFYYRGSQLQSASDLASLAGAEMQSQGASEAEIRDTVNDVLESNGVDLGTVDADILLFADQDEVQVSLNDKDVSLYLSSFL